MKCLNCGHMVNSQGWCSTCGIHHKYIEKAFNTADYYYNLGLEKANLKDMSSAVAMLEKALSYNKRHIDARNLLGLVYFETGEGGKACRQWQISAAMMPDESNLAVHFIQELNKEPAIFSAFNESARKFNLGLTYARQGSEDLALIQLKKVVSTNPKYVPGHLLYALLQMKSGDNEAARKEVEAALAIDPYNTTAQKYMAELTGTVPKKPGKPAVAVIKKEESKIKPIDHYEDPDKERWKQFVYVLIGAGLAALAMFVLVIPSVRSGVNLDYNSLKTEYEQAVQAKDSKIKTLEEDKKSYEDKNKKLQKKLSVYEGSDGEDSMYDSVLKASQAYTKGDYTECIEYLEKVDKAVLPSKTAKKLYNSMKENAYPKAADQLYAQGKEAYDSYDYEKALGYFKDSYDYKESYSTKYFLAMCYKRTGDVETGNKYLYDIINNSGDSSLIQQAANYGLEMTVNDARVAAGQDPVDVYGYDPDSVSYDDSDDYNEE